MAKRIIVLISGSGSNLQALINAKLPILLVVSNRKDAYGLLRAKEAGIPTMYIPLKPYTDAGKSRAEYDADLAATLLPYQPDLIVLAGWMHIFSPAFLDQFPGKVINLHPALPGQFPGTHAIQRAYEAFQRDEIEVSGCMVHHVIPEVDAGAVIGQAVVPFIPEEPLAEYEHRLHAAEHQLLVAAVRLCLGE